jgi:RNA polymerase sigma factor (sigma-70 family)
MSQDKRKLTITQFLATERKKMIRYVRRLIEDAGDRDGEDIVQDVALNLFDRVDVLMPIETLSAYVYQSLRNRVIDYLRRRRNDVPWDESIHGDHNLSLLRQLSDGLGDAEEEISRAQLRKKIFEAIERLPDEQKAIVIETELNGRTFRDLSQEWEIAMGTLLARKSRAIAKIRESLRDLRT